MSLAIYYQNVRGLRTKTTTILQNNLSNDYDIIALTESWLTKGIRDDELFDPRYYVYRRDRDYASTGQRLGGGVVLAIKQELISVARPEWTSCAEDIWVTIRTNTTPHSLVHICCAYIPGGTQHQYLIENFLNTLSDVVSNNPKDSFIILGDFNLSEISWIQTTPSAHYAASNYSTHVSNQFVDCMHFLDLSQYNSELNSSGHVLDLILSNLLISVEPNDDPLVPEDAHHKALSISVPFQETPSLTNAKRKVFLYNRGDYDSINFALEQADWASIFSTSQVEPALDGFYTFLKYLINLHIPHKFLWNSKYPPWYNAALIKVTKEKSKYFSKYKKYKNQADYDAFSLLRKRHKDLCRKIKSRYLSNIENNISSNPKNFWSHVKSSNTSQGIPKCMYFEELKASNGTEIANLFSKYFSSVFSKPSDPLTLDPTDVGNHTSNISNIEVTREIVLKYLKEIDTNKGAGPDEIPSIFIKQCAHNLALPLSLIFNRSLTDCTVPVLWKSAYVSPIFKNGKKTDVKNYRPISKLCIFNKILEKIVYDQLYAALKPSLNTNQHGFISGKSTTTNLLTFTEYLQDNLDNRIQVDTIYTDYSKAFDKVDHSTLLNKLLKIGIHGNLYRWLSSYISNRSQIVVVAGFKSDSVAVTSGVPQGSLLGPLLFNIYINDIGNCFLNSQTILYADDMKIFSPINSIEDCQKLQEDLLRLNTYCNAHGLELNTSKCFVVRFTRNKNIFIHEYSINHQPLSTKSEIRDLGVILDSKLNFNKHIDHIVTNASSMLGFIIRSCKQFKDLTTFKILYFSYVRSILEYASQVWNPGYAIHKNRIESVQNRFLRYLNFRSFRSHISNEDSAKFFNIQTLMCRRNISDLVMLFKITHNLIDSPDLLQRLLFHVPNRNSRQSLTFNLPLCKTNSKQNSFIYRSTHSFNLNYNHIDIFNSTLRDIKRKLTH